MFEWFGTDEIDTRTEIEKYFDNMGYFEHRDIVYEARKGNLSKVYPLVPFTQKQVLEFAFIDRDKNWGGASYNALAGAENYTALMGEPEINPLTMEKNSEQAQKGILVNAYDGTTKKITELLTKAFIGIALLGVGYLFLKPYFENITKGKK